MRRDLLSQAESIALMIRPEDVEKLSFTAGDSTNTYFQSLRAQLTTYAKAAGHRSIYTQAQRGNNLVLGPSSSLNPHAPASAPGTVCPQPSAVNRAVFDTGTPSTQGLTGEVTEGMVSAFAPVKDPAAGKVLMVVGLDMDGGEWRAAKAQARLPTLLSTLVVMLAIRVGAGLIRRPPPKDAPTNGESGWVNATVVGAIGLTITAAAGLWAREVEGKSFREAFAYLAEVQGKVLVNSLSDIRDYRLAGLACFLQTSGETSRERFHEYAASLTRDGFAQAWEWIPAVPAAERAQVEAAAQRDGAAAFAIYEQDAQGHRMPAAQRDWYYPVLYVEPLAGNERALGYDLGSERLRKAALQEAMRTEMATATDPITAVQETASQKGTVLYYPVFTQAEPRRLRGFAVTVLRLGTVLQAALVKTGHDQAAVLVKLIQVFPDQAPAIIGILGRHRLAGARGHAVKAGGDAGGGWGEDAVLCFWESVCGGHGAGTGLLILPSAPGRPAHGGGRAARQCGPGRVRGFSEQSPLVPGSASAHENQPVARKRKPAGGHPAVDRRRRREHRRRRACYRPEHGRGSADGLERRGGRRAPGG